MKPALAPCQHGDRRIARFNPATRTFVTVADRFDGKRFNSPNDVVVRPNGDVYFTDPIYGLVGHGTIRPARSPGAASTAAPRRAR